MKHATMILVLAALAAGACLAQTTYPAPTATYDATVPKVVVIFDVPGFFPPAGFACWDIRLTRFSPDPAEYAFTYHQASRSVHLYLDAPLPEGAYWIDAQILDVDGETLAFAERGEFSTVPPITIYHADLGLLAHYDNGTWTTAIQIYNPSDKEAAVILTAYRSDGFKLMEAELLIPGHGAAAYFLQTLLLWHGVFDAVTPHIYDFNGGGTVDADRPVVVTSWAYGPYGTIPATVQARPADPTMKRR